MPTTERFVDVKFLLSLANKFRARSLQDTTACIYKNILILDPKNEVAKRELSELFGLYYIYKGRGHVRQVIGLDWSFDAKFIITYGLDNLIGVWSTETRRIVRLLDSGSSGLTCLVVHPKDYSFVAGNRDGEIILYEFFTCKRTQIGRHEGSVVSLKFSPEGKRLVSSDDEGNVVMWSFSRKKKAKSFASYGEPIRVFKWSVGGRYLLGLTHERYVNVWNIRTGKILYRFDVGDRITDASWSPLGEKIVVSGYEGNLYFLNLRSNITTSVPMHDYLISHVFWTRDNRIISVGWDGHIKILDAYNLDVIADIDSINEPIVYARMTRNERYLALATVKKRIYFLRLYNNELSKLKIDDGFISGISWRHGAPVLAVSTFDRKIYIINADNNEVISLFDSGVLDVTSLQWLPKKKLVAMGFGDGSVGIYDTDLNKFISKKKLHDDRINFLSFNFNQDLIAVTSEDTTVSILKIPHLERICSYCAPPFGARMARFHPKKNIVALGCYDGRIRLIDSSCNLIDEVNAHDNIITAIDWNKTGEYLSSASLDGTIKVWSVGDWSEIATIRTDDEVTCMDWNKKVNFIAYGTSTGKVYIWNLDREEPYISFKVHTAPIISVRWSIDGVKLASCGMDGKLVVYQIVRKSYKVYRIGSPICAVTWGGRSRELYCGCINGDLAIVRA